MKKYTSVFIIFTSAILILASCGGGKTVTGNTVLNNPEVNKTDGSASGKKSTNNSAYDYNKVLKAQKNLLKDFSWPGMYELDLNDDGIKEKFLAVEGYSRGMSYVLFLKHNKSWILISGDEDIPSGHLGIEKSAVMNMGWHDFTAYQPSGRDGLIESCYSWDGKKYFMKSQKEILNKE